MSSVDSNRKKEDQIVVVWFINFDWFAKKPDSLCSTLVWEFSIRKKTSLV